MRSISITNCWLDNQIFIRGRNEGGICCLKCTTRWFLKQKKRSWLKILQADLLAGKQKVLATGRSTALTGNDLPSVQRVYKASVKWATKNVKLVLQHYCKTSWIANHVARFTTHVLTCLATNKVARFFFMGGKTRNIIIQLVLQQSRKTSCTFYVAHFTVP